MTALAPHPDAVSAEGVCQQVGASAPTCTFLTLPEPPSVNNMFANVPGKGRIKSREYKNWTAIAAMELKLQRPERVEGRVIVSIGVERDSASADIDNRVKAILDLLVQPGPKRADRVFGVIEDDRMVTGLLVAWTPRGTARTPKARIAITPAASLTAHFHPTADGATGGWFFDAPETED